jgi:hypothetical protein
MTAYQLYSPITELQRDKFLEMAKLHGDKAEYRRVKKMTGLEYTRELFEYAPEAMMQSLECQMMADEYRWRKTGRHVIYPGDADFLHQLLSAKYDLTSIETINLPFTSFMLPIPTNFRIDGGNVNGMLVNIYRGQEKIDLPDQLFKSLNLNLKSIPAHTFELDDLLISICMMDNGKRFNRAGIRSVDTIQHLTGIINAPDHITFSEQIGQFPQGMFTDMKGLNEDDSRMIFYAYKIVAALNIYHSATHGKYLFDRTGGGIRTVGRFIGTPTPHYLIPEKMPRAEHTRRWHFRQLRDKRYYQGEYAHLPPGSRFVFVKETTVNAPE